MLLARYRAARGWSQGKLAQVAGFDPSTVSRLESGARAPERETVDRLADAMALQNARDVYTRRNEGLSIWVVKADDISASSPDEKDPLFTPANDKVYRHPTFYSIPDDVPHM